ncbi:MAG: PilN domain-containing protein [Gammaproteobacteria bacterium]|nr:PilN domain-containing protein [Gammaproteobacteria bacterium]
MKQQINLYQEQFRLKRVVLPANEIFALLGIGIVVLILASIVMQVTKNKMTEVQADLARQNQNLTTNNDQLRNKIAEHQVAADLQKSVADANRKLLARKRVLEWVRRSQAEERIRFSALLEGLGRRRINGLWLSEVSIDQKGGSMQLQGNTLNPELVPVFLADLKKEKAFSGTEFRKIKIEEQNSDRRLMQFLLTTEPPKDDEKVSGKKRNARS